MVRFKNRYLLCELSWDGTPESMPTAGALTSLIRDSVQLNFGDCCTGLLQGTVSVKYFDPTTRIFILRTARDLFRQVWAGLFFITLYKGKRISVRALHVGGTMKQCQRPAAKYGDAALERLYASGSLDDEIDGRDTDGQ